MSAPERKLFFLAPLFDLVYIEFENSSKRILLQTYSYIVLKPL